jgi:hypothetical protein
MKPTRSVFATTLILQVTLSACGPSPEPATPTTSGATDEPTTTGDPGDAPAPDPTAKEGPTAEPGAPSVPVGPSQMLADLGKIGINMKKVPALEKIPLAQKKKIMPLFQKSLGLSDCTGCHIEGDFKKETRNIQMARNMWNNYVVNLRDEKGENVFCDSCHSGKEQLLNRHDKDALQKFMETEYQDKMTLASGEEHSCSTCHTDAFETKIFEKLWKIPSPSGS